MEIRNLDCPSTCLQNLEELREIWVMISGLPTQTPNLDSLKTQQKR